MAKGAALVRAPAQRTGTDRIVREEVAWGCRMLHYFGHTDLTLGHVSGRHGTASMWMKSKGLPVFALGRAYLRGPSPQRKQVGSP